MALCHRAVENHPIPTTESSPLSVVLFLSRHGLLVDNLLVADDVDARACYLIIYLEAIYLVASEAPERVVGQQVQPAVVGVIHHVHRVSLCYISIVLPVVAVTPCFNFAPRGGGVKCRDAWQGVSQRNGHPGWRRVGFAFFRRDSA